MSAPYPNDPRELAFLNWVKRVRQRKSTLSKQGSRAYRSTTTEILFWSVVLITWVLTAYHWVLIVGVLLRLAWWWKAAGSAHLKAKTGSSKPKDAASAHQVTPFLKWFGKLLVVVAALLVALATYAPAGLIVLLAGVVWLRVPGKPWTDPSTGRIHLPKPYLYALLGHLIVFLHNNWIAPGKIIVVGPSIGPFGHPEPTNASAVTDIEVDVGIFGYILGVATVVIKSKGGDTDRTVTACWGDPATMALFMLKALRES